MTDAVGNLFVMLGDGSSRFHGLTAFPPPTIYTGAALTQNQTFADIYGSLATADFRNVGKKDAILVLAGKSVMLLKNGSVVTPEIVPSGVVNAATVGVSPLVPGSLVAIFGTNLAYGSGSKQDPFPFDPYLLSSTLFGLTVEMNGVLAPLLYASPGQANVQVPWELAGKTEATLVVVRNGVAKTITVPITTYSPGLFVMNGQGSGQAAAIIATTPGAIPAPSGIFAGSRPVHRGEYVSLYGTGLGPVTNPPGTGELVFYPGYSTFPFRLRTSTPTVTVGGAPAAVQFSGLAPAILGVYQINILIPDAAPAGDAVRVQLSIGGGTSNAVTSAIQ